MRKQREILGGQSLQTALEPDESADKPHKQDGNGREYRFATEIREERSGDTDGEENYDRPNEAVTYRSELFDAFIHDDSGRRWV